MPRKKKDDELVADFDLTNEEMEELGILPNEVQNEDIEITEEPASPPSVEKGHEFDWTLPSGNQVRLKVVKRSEHLPECWICAQVSAPLSQFVVNESEIL